MFKHYNVLEERLGLDESKVIIDLKDYETAFSMYNDQLVDYFDSSIELVRELALRYIVDTDRYLEFEKCLKDIERFWI
jgi:uncharacterized membrane-anchored protein YhcB (DUF1043 family)